jgi:hypothetical protein
MKLPLTKGLNFLLVLLLSAVFFSVHIRGLAHEVSIEKSFKLSAKFTQVRAELPKQINTNIRKQFKGKCPVNYLHIGPSFCFKEFSWEKPVGFLVYPSCFFCTSTPINRGPPSFFI